MSLNLVLENAHVLTLDPRLPVAKFVAIEGDRIAAVGDMSKRRNLSAPGARRIDCQSMTLVPGFNDAHLHLLAFASTFGRVDCRPGMVRSIAQIVEAVGQRADRTPPGQLVRAYGYDEFYLEEGRHPTRWDLDQASIAHPIRLDHRTGHASVVNSPVLALLDIGRETPDPMDGVIERDETTGEPTGLLFEMSKYLQPLREPASSDEFFSGIQEANSLLISKGITSVQDATPENDLARWRVFQELKGQCHLAPRVSMMAGAPYLDSFLKEGLSPGCGDSAIRIGAVKVLLSLTTGSLQPCQEELAQIVARVHEGGFQIAIHAVEREAVEAAAEALLNAQQARPRPKVRHRIEHCSECPPHLVRKVALSRSIVTTQPAFIHHYGAKYLSQTDEQLVPYLYPIRSLHMAGVPLAAGSDAPVAVPDPILSIYTAATRTMQDGQAFPGDQQVSAHDALRMHTLGGAFASLEERYKGSIQVGKLADLVLLTADPTGIEPDAIRDIGVAMTMIGGGVVWEA